MGERLKSAATVVIITWLIWWSADRRVTDIDEFVLRLAVVTNDQTAYAMIESPSPAEVRATVSGTRGRLDALRARLRQSPDLRFEYLLPAEDREPGSYWLPAAKMLAESRTMLESGLNVELADPAQVKVLVDRYEEVRMRIEPDFGTVGVEDVACQPQTVEVRRVPSMLLVERYSEPVLRPNAERAVRQWMLAHPDEPDFEVELTLSLPDAPHGVEFSPSPRVKVVGRVVSQLATERKGPVQIVFSIPPDVQRQYVVRPSEKSNFRPDIWVRGARNQIEQLAPQDVFVYVEVLASDAAGTVKTIRRAPHVILPPGFELEREPEEVEFELVERSGTGVRE